MKIYLAQGESRSFDFSAIGQTEAEAEHAIIETFKAHARHYDLPLDWWLYHADYHIIEMETGACYRDRSKINAKWYNPPELTEEDLEGGLNICDYCETKHPSIDMFWNVHWDEHTPRQQTAIQFMNKHGYEAICQTCFDNCTEEV